MTDVTVAQESSGSPPLPFEDPFRLPGELPPIPIALDTTNPANPTPAELYRIPRAPAPNPRRSPSQSVSRHTYQLRQERARAIHLYGGSSSTSCYRAVYLTSIRAPGQQDMVIMSACKKIWCPYCGPLRKLRYERKLLRHFKGVVAFELTVESPEFAKLKRRIERKLGRYDRCLVRGGRTTILSDVAFHPDAKSISVKSFARHVRKILRQLDLTLPARTRFVTSSRGWDRPPPIEKRLPDYRSLGTVGRDVFRSLSQAGARLESIISNTGLRMVRVAMPDEVWASTFRYEDVLVRLGLRLPELPAPAWCRA